MAWILETQEVHGVERITTGRNLVGLVPARTHCYRIGSTLIDAGSPNCAQRILESLDGTEITHVLVTHRHEDHVGAAAALADQGARVLAPEPILPLLAQPPELPYFRSISWGTADPVEAEPLGKAVETPDGRFEVVPAPGHSPDHVAFHEPDRGWLFSGDAYLGRRKVHRFAEELGPMMETWRRLRDLEASHLFPGHGRVREDPDEELATTIEWYEDLIEQAGRLRAEGRHVRSIRKQLLGREGWLTLYTGGEFSKTNLARQLLRAQP